MKQKEEIIKTLLSNESMTQSELAEAIYGDKKKSGNIYIALTKLVDEKKIVKSKDHPAKYSIFNLTVSNARTTSSNSVSNNNLNINLDLVMIQNAEKDVMKDPVYGSEIKLVKRCLKKFPNNTDIDIVAMKIALIDVTNSTNLSKYKSKISIPELAKIIVNINDIDERIDSGDPEVVNEIARCNGQINLFSFASKYCCYHNKYVYDRDDYSIFDTVMEKHMLKYFKNNTITQKDIKSWRKNTNYKKYNDFITENLYRLGIKNKYRKRQFDLFVWYNNR